MKTKKKEIEINESAIPLSAISFINSDNISYLKPIKASIVDEYGMQYYRYDVQVLAPVLEKIILKEENFKFVRDSNIGSTFIYAYRNGYYQLMSENQFKGVIASWIPPEIRKSKDIDEIFKLLSMENDLYINMTDLNTDSNYINFRNGLLNLKTMELEEHTPDKFFTVQIPVEYKPLGECEYGKTFEEYMEMLCDGDEIMYNTLLELMGLCISNIPGYMTKKCILMYGKKDTGKTQIKKLLTKLIGIEYTSSIELSKISSNNFATSELYNKRLAGSNDMSYTGIEDLSIWKQLTGGDPISVEFKGRGAFSYIFTGLMWFLANDLPKFSGKKEEAIYERFIIIPCNNVIPKEKQDPYLVDKMLLESEYIVSLCINHLKKLIDRKFKILESGRMEEELDNYRIINNTLLQFVEECCYIDDNMKSSYRLRISEFKRTYQTWCKYNNVKPIALKEKEMLYYLEPKYGTKVKKTDGYPCLTNIKLNDNLDLPANNF